jgi:pre-mRNA-splicing factor ISY1
MQPQPSQTTAKRKTADDESDLEMDGGTRDESKRTKTDGDLASTVAQTASTTTNPVLLHAQTAASFIPFLDAEHLLPPKVPSREEMETVLLQLRKKALVEEYFGDEK